MSEQAPTRDETRESARRIAAASYLDVRYTAERRPYTSYPELLCRYLTATYLNDPSLKMLVELGPGRGEFLHAFAQCGLNVLGVDNSLHSERPFPESIMVADIEGKPIPVATDSVDVVFSKSVIEHIYNTDLFLSEIYRALRPGGLMIVMTPDWKAQFRHFYDDYTHVRPFTIMGLTDVVESHRFLIRDSRRFRQLPFLWRRPYLRLISDVLEWMPERFKRYKIVKFSKEWMLLVVAEKPT